jgi:hypothetical protein
MAKFQKTPPKSQFLLKDFNTPLAGSIFSTRPFPQTNLPGNNMEMLAETIVHNPFNYFRKKTYMVKLFLSVDSTCVLEPITLHLTHSLFFI